MSQIIDSFECSQNYKRGYRKGISMQKAQANVVFIPRYVKYVIPALQISIGIAGAILIGMYLFA